MKGVLADWISSVLPRVSIGKIFGYAHRYELGDLEDDDLVTKYLLVNSIPSGIPDPITHAVIAGDAQPVTIPYAPFVSPNVKYRNADGSRYSGATDTDDGTNIIVTGDADGSGNFA